MEAKRERAETPPDLWHAVSFVVIAPQRTGLAVRPVAPIAAQAPFRGGNGYTGKWACPPNKGQARMSGVQFAPAGPVFLVVSALKAWSSAAFRSAMTGAGAESIRSCSCAGSSGR